MKTLNDYINDPSVINEQMPLREVHAIRLMIHDETKNLTPSEKTACYDNVRKEAQEKYGIQFVPSVRR